MNLPLTLCDHQIGDIDFCHAVIDSLSQSAKSIPSKYFYDQAGSQLFDQICELDEYYLTRCESEIMSRSSDAIADAIGPKTRLIEYGSGSSTKTRLLLDHLQSPAQYVPVDISAEHLLESSERLKADYPKLAVTPVVADFCQPFEIPECESAAASNCVYFPGSTIGNFLPGDASDLLRSIHAQAGPGGQMLIGFDRQKDAEVIQRAYDDRLGVTAEFNKNLLRRINRELDGDFNLSAFDHRAVYDSVHGRIEMHLVSSRDQRVHIAGHDFDFCQDESIRTEYSHKYSLHGFQKMASQVGWTNPRVWTDKREYFAVVLLDRAA
jgi:dimethylhistidine N-methyltransferase